MTIARPALLLLLAACVTRSGPTSAPSDPPPAAEPPIASAPPTADTSPPPAEFWKVGQAACPEGATFKPSTPPYYNASCTRDGKYDGPTATFDADGHLLVLERYVLGQAEGTHLAYWQNGTKQLEMAWHDGKEHGPFTRWYENGQKAEQGAYRDGRLDGTVRAWDDRGKDLPPSNLTHGTGTYIQWFGDGKKQLERTYVDGLEHGPHIQWHPGGAKFVEAQMRRGAKDGPYSEWDSDGRPSRSGQYAADVEAGTWTFHDPDGQVAHVDTYADGDVVAVVTYQDGKPLAKPAADQACSTPRGLATTYKKATGEPLDDSHNCVRRAVHFPGVVAVGAFAHDRGCGPRGTLVDCKFSEEVDGAKVLARAGWQRARPGIREQIARDYVSEVGLVWNMSGEPDVTREDNGDLTVTGTTTIVGMRGSSSYATKFTFTPAGVVKRAKSE